MSFGVSVFEDNKILNTLVENPTCQLEGNE
jgi:hypothetical protein